MTNQETSVANWFSTTLSSSVSNSTLTFPVDSIGSLSSPAYIIIDPDNAAKREVILADGTWGASSFVASALSDRGLSGSASGAQAHDSGTTVEVRPLAQHVEDLNDRVEGHAHGGGSDGAQVDHGGLGGLGDDDHSQYYNASRHTKAVHDALALDHGSLTGLADDDHTNLFNSTRHDAHDHSAAAASIASGDLADHTKATHDALALDHGSLTGNSDDDHTQYLNTSRHNSEHTSSGAGGVVFAATRDTAVTGHGTASRTVSASITIPSGWNGYTLVIDFTLQVISTSGTRRLITLTPKLAGSAIAGQNWDHTIEDESTKDDALSGRGFWTGETTTGSRTYALTIALNASDASVSSDNVVVTCTAYRTS